MEHSHKIPYLEHGLELVLEKPGLYKIEELKKIQQDKGKFLEHIYQPNEINFNSIPDYIPPSQDLTLKQFAKESKTKYIMSTSTISQVLSQIYYILNRFKRPNFDELGQYYENETKNYMISQRKPVTNYLRKVEDSIYAFDSDKGIFELSNVVLMELGKVSERQFTLSSEKFRKVMLKDDHPDKLPNEDQEKIEDDYHRFMKLNNDICIRSQIDTQYQTKDGKRLIFEIKTRACAPMRYDIENYLQYSDYQVDQYLGLHSSFEREYYDLIRGAFLKYSFQLKIGNMDGAFFAYHNTLKNFGFEYVDAKEIYKRVFGSVAYSDLSFMVSARILTHYLDLILEDLQNNKYEMLKIGFYSCCIRQKLVCFVELFEENKEWTEQAQIKKDKNLQDEYDYYTKVVPMKNKIYKYEMSLFTFINGIYLNNEIYDFQDDDQLSVRYRFNKLGQADFDDYMNFLHEAYKFETLNYDINYAGIWVNISKQQKS